MKLSKQLLDWFHKNQRPLPWRKRYRPYEVWISEIMLQQTQVETVLPYFKRWMKTFPTLESLAKADEKKVLKLWEGLGYYSRARNLHESAKFIMQKYGGVFPDDFENIRSLKGVGRYTAGAIASIAFNQEKPIVDGNVLRVLSRVYAISTPIDVPMNTETFWTLQEKLIPKGQARFFNQALMELGALVCAKDNPSCAICPIRNFCKAFKQGNAENYPVRSKRKKMVKIEASALVLSQKGKYFIQKRPLGSIMGGLWEFPEWKLAKNAKLAPEKVKEKTRKLAEKDFGVKLAVLRHLGTIKRNYTHHNEMLHVNFANIQSEGVAKIASSRPLEGQSSSTSEFWLSSWVTKKDFRHYPFSSAHAKIASLLS